MDHLLFYLQLLLYTLGATVVCGLVVWGCKSLFIYLMGRGIGYKIVVGTGIIGTPVHELGHALMCLIFGHRITEICLWQPRSDDGTLGYVNHSYNSRNIYHIIGNIFIGIGPIFSGMLVLGTCLYFAFPASLANYTASVTQLLNTSATPLDMLTAGIRILPDMIGEFSSESFPIWGRIILLIVMLCVSLHINLSPADIKGALSAIPLYLILMLLVAAVCVFLGTGVMHSALWYVKMINAYMMALFTVVLVFALLQVAIGSVFWLIRKITR